MGAFVIGIAEVGQRAALAVLAEHDPAACLEGERPVHQLGCSRMVDAVSEAAQERREAGHEALNPGVERAERFPALGQPLAVRPDGVREDGAVQLGEAVGGIWLRSGISVLMDWDSAVTGSSSQISDGYA